MAHRNVVTLHTQREETASAAADAAVVAFSQKRLTVQESAVEADVSINTIRRAYTNGHLLVQRFGVGKRSIRILRRDLAAWLEAGGQTGVER